MFIIINNNNDTLMEETALAFTDIASYCFTSILLLLNSLTFAFFSNFPDQFKNFLMVETLTIPIIF